MSFGFMAGISNFSVSFKGAPLSSKTSLRILPSFGVRWYPSLSFAFLYSWFFKFESSSTKTSKVVEFDMLITSTAIPVWSPQQCTNFKEIYAHSLCLLSHKHKICLLFSLSNESRRASKGSRCGRQRVRSFPLTDAIREHCQREHEFSLRLNNEQALNKCTRSNLDLGWM